MFGRKNTVKPYEVTRSEVIRIIESKCDYYVPHDPICQRCEKRFSTCKCKSGFVSTGSLMLPEKKDENVL